jgi:CBS domain-containing protein
VVSELRDVRDFLAQHPPLASLPGQALDELPRRVSVRYLRRGRSFPPDGADASAFYVLRKGAIELRDGSGTLLDRLGEGDSFDATTMCSAEGPGFVGITIEDALIYVLSGATLAQLRQSHPMFDASFERSLLQRLRRAREAAMNAPPVGGNLLRLKVADVVARAPVTAPPDLMVQEAAALMTRERVSSLMVVQDMALEGIVTDRDLRSRCIAEGLGGAVTLRQVMTARPHTISPDASAFEAVLAMSQLRIHHLPVVDHEGVRGMVSTHDLLRAQTANTMYVADRIGRCGSLPALRGAMNWVRELHVQLVAANATAQQLGLAIATVCDAVTRRLIELAIERLGEPPVPFAWIATGSQGRGELTVRSDQDNSIILDDAFENDRHDAYFDALASSVNEGLDACGYERCPGEVMASNPRWRQPVATWTTYFTGWLENTDYKAAALAANFFDMRTVWGRDELRQRLMAAILPRCTEDAVFRAYLAGHALSNRPPLGFFRNLVLERSGDHVGTVDLKMHGLLPIVDLARLYALASGVEAVGTLQRLKDAAGTPMLSEEGAENLRAAFEYIWMLRARHQAEQLRRNEQADNFVAPDALRSMERRHLRDAFAAIATMQDAVRVAHGDRLPR